MTGLKLVKRQLREHFSIEQGAETVVGPCEVEVTEDVAKLNEHKFEVLQEEPKKKQKIKAEAE